jgi:hypothetical protein
MSSTNTTSDATAKPYGLYDYDPSMAGAALAGLLFGVSAVIHLIQMIMKRTWFYTPMTVGSFSMFIVLPVTMSSVLTLGS